MLDIVHPAAAITSPQKTTGSPGGDGRWCHTLLVEDDASRSTRRSSPGMDPTKRTITVRVHQILHSSAKLEAEKSYDTGTLQLSDCRATVALDLLDCTSRGAATVVTAGTSYGANNRFLCGLQERGLAFAVELPPSAEVSAIHGSADWSPTGAPAPLADLLPCANWSRLPIVHPTTRIPIDYEWADFGPVLRQGIRARLLIIQTGQVRRLQRGTIFALISDEEVEPAKVVSAIGWTRWIRPFVRKLERSHRKPAINGAVVEMAQSQVRRSGEVALRVNIATARQQDEAQRRQVPVTLAEPVFRRRLLSGGGELRVAELFAGAGGMGLGFLMAGSPANRYRLVFSGEVHPIYVSTLRRNHAAVAAANPDADLVPSVTEALDLRTAESLDFAAAQSRSAGGVQVLIGGPPCQGFSSANRNSGHSSNPHNELVDVFLSYVERLRPQVFLMENVQGIVWTPKSSEADQLSVADDFTHRMRAAGYLVFPKLLDAVWYGVPQHRNRFFIMGLAQDLGYSADDFDEWGPFPRPTHGPGTTRPYVTVGDAIGDLPWLANGSNGAELSYNPPASEQLLRNEFLRIMRAGAPRDVVWDHVTSRHAPYVIDRYRRIPQGGNWEAIVDMLTNYSDIGRTHSNIYRRLVWGEPSITIGHYRKSMLIHPNEDRGLSLREASRLQSFPDWFRFSGSADDATTSGLTHKQQQLANAVCPLVTKAIADFIIQL